MTAFGHGGCPRPDKVDQAQALARSCAGGPGFQQCDRGYATCAIHTHGKCCKLHWSCHMGWCHCKYVYQRMTPVEQLPSTVVPGGITPGRIPACSLLISPSRSPCGARATVEGGGGGGVDASRAAAGAAAAAAGTKQAILSEGFKIRRVNGTLCYVQHLLLSPRCTSAYMVLDGGFADSTPICGRGWRQQQQQQPLASLIVSPCSSPCSGGSGSAGESADSGMPASPDSADEKRSDAEEETEGEGDEDDGGGGGGDANDDDDTCSLQTLASGVGLGGEMPQLRANRMRGISEVVDVIETTV